MRIDLPQCGFKNCRFNSDGNCRRRSEYERCDHAHAIMMLERLIMDDKICWLCQYARHKQNGKCDGTCAPIWNGYYSAVRSE